MLLQITNNTRRIHCFSNEMRGYDSVAWVCFRSAIFVPQNLWGQSVFIRFLYFVASAERSFSSWFITRFVCQGLFHLQYEVQKDFHQVFISWQYLMHLIWLVEGRYLIKCVAWSQHMLKTINMRKRQFRWNILVAKLPYITEEIN